MDQGNFYHLGDYCIEYISEEHEIINYVNRTMKCKQYTNVLIIEQNNNKEYHQCIDSPLRCEYKYYDIEKDRCVSSCDKNKIINKTHSGSDYYYFCKDECEFLKGSDGKIQKFKHYENGNIYCLEECPSNAPYFYETYNNTAPVCLEECDENDFYNADSINNKKCSKSCRSNQLYKIEKRKL